MTAGETPSAATVAWCEVLSAALVAVGLFTILVGALHDFRVTLMVGGGIVEIYWSQRLRRRTHAKTSEVAGDGAVLPCGCVPPCEGHHEDVS